ncbi:P-loop containing nucleoside triphosphate hydrolase protein [Mycena crocata]|nr:P-loop containing nucleoside triphosphate hydrolase protein [Mycena crocata]
MSHRALEAFNSLPGDFMTSLTAYERRTVLDAFLYVDFASLGSIVPRDLQLRSTVAVRNGQDLIVRARTGSGKTLAMIIPVLLMGPDAIAITLSPLRLIQDSHVKEFSKFGISSIAINCFTPDDRALWKKITNHSEYRHYAVSPEQCGSYQGHVTRFAKLLHTPKWTKKVKLLQIDEGHFISTVGQPTQDSSVAFRPAFSDLGERLRIHLPASTPCAVYSASMPPDVIELIMKTLRMAPEKTVKLELCTNRPNLIYATIPMMGTLDNFANVDFLIPDPFPPNYIFDKSMTFIDDKLKSASLAEYLNAKCPPEIAAKKPFRHYHSSMSKEYLEETANEFKKADGDCKGLIATESASNGLDVPDISLIVMFGVPKTPFEADQRAGRGGRDGRRCLVLTIGEDWAVENLAESNLNHEPCAKELRTSAVVISWACTEGCRRRAIATHNNDTTPLAVEYSTEWCCDNCDALDFAMLLPGRILTSSPTPESVTPTRKPRKKYRPVALREDLVDNLTQWRKSAHTGDPVARNFPIGYILEEKSMVLIAREARGRFKIPADITEFLSETEEWHSKYFLNILSVVVAYDRAPASSDNSSESSSDSDFDLPSSDEESDNSPEVAPAPSAADSQIIIRAHSPSSSSSRSNTPEPEDEPSPAFNTLGRPLRRTAENHTVSGIAAQVQKRRKIAGE